MSVVVSVGPHWPRYSALKHLVIFGASYCDVGYNSKQPHPSPDNPLGVKWPGKTWAEPNQPNWVGHLLSEYSNNQSLLVYDYAKGGDTVFGVQRQITRDFLPHVAQKPDWAPWTAGDTLFMTWIGINDAGRMPDRLSSHIDKLFELQDILYDTGARNFLFFNVPPIHRAPGTPAHLKNTKHSPYAEWNDGLQTAVQKFATKHSDVTVMVFSSWDTFTRVLDNPTEFGFTENDVDHPAGIWVDHLHPTSRMHNIIACDLACFMQSVPQYTQS